ncbi:integral membrane protein [Ophiostoma piceae UAMH 11346]|uniref:Integral membrane protein n=1 Tax=Ophiostoma piceae (strain UAMH 11346) TaxID=1262450 RepID=S3CBC2_OPHP1|nr:integral membrane protein [Ophiostoma piceae UAMH 11346]
MAWFTPALPAGPASRCEAAPELPSACAPSPCPSSISPPSISAQRQSPPAQTSPPPRASAMPSRRIWRPSPPSSQPTSCSALPRLRGLSVARMNMLCVMLVVLLAFIPIQPARAASVSFSNCLSDEYRHNRDPVLLQWLPLHVDASFDTANNSHNLVVTLYGNVTGSRSSTALALWNSTLWADANYTDGKILREPDPASSSPKLTTLHNKIDVLSYEPWNGDTDFCDQSLTNASCPLAPVFNTSVVPFYDLPSITMASDMNASYAFASFSATFLIRYGDEAATTIGCVQATVTPSLGHLAWAIKFLPLMVLLAVGFATIFAGMYSPWGTTDIFHWSSNYGRDPDLLRLVTPGFGDCLQYLQFAVLTGGLTLSYPGFYQPIVSQAAWSALMFNQTIVSKYDGMPKTVDGIYITNGTFGMQNLAQLTGMGQVEDIWAGMMVWLLGIIGGSLVLFQLGFAFQWIYRFVRKIPEEDLRSKNWPFSIGHVIRIVFNFLLLPIVALSSFQFVVAAKSPDYTTALAAVTLVAIIGFSVWLLYLIISTKPRAVLFDDLPTLLLYGPLYNTYSDEAAFYALSPFSLTLVRGIAIGAVQPAGIAQIVLLAICEVVQVLTLQAILPFHRQSSMNAYHTLFAVLRFVTIMLMIAFIPVLGVDEGTKGWFGYVILVIHAGVLILGFFLNAVQTVLEVIARMAGAGGDDVAGQTRGGLSKIFGMRQLSRRTMPRRAAGATSRQSQMSSAAMLVSEDASKTGYIMPSGRLRSESAGSIGVLMASKPGQRSSSALDNFSVENGLAATRNLESGGGGAYTPTTAGEMSSFSYLPSPNLATGRATNTGAAAGYMGGMGGNNPVETADPYYRPPRRARRPTINQDNTPSPAERTRGSWASGDWSQGALSPDGAGPAPPAATAAAASGRPVSSGAANSAAPVGPVGAGISLTRPSDPAEYEGQLSRGVTPAPHPPQSSGISFSPRTDYSTREVDFYYGVRGQRLNSDAPNRRLGTGPADPTGPIASATGWFFSMIGGKTKEKGKGFEVVRSARMPPAMKARGGDFEDDGPPPGIPVAMNVIRNGPIESDDEDDKKKAASQRKRRSAGAGASGHGGEATNKPAETDLLDADGNPGDVGDEDNSEPPLLPDIDAGSSIHIGSRLPSREQSQISRHQSQISRHQSQASRYGAGGVPILHDVPHPPRKKSKAPHVNKLVVPPGLASSVGDGESSGAESAGGLSGLSGRSGLSGHSGLSGRSGHVPTTRLPFEGQLSEGSSAITPAEFAQVDMDAPSDTTGASGENANARRARPTSFGYVQQGSVNRVDPEYFHESAEVVDERR